MRRARFLSLGVLFALIPPPAALAADQELSLDLNQAIGLALKNNPQIDAMVLAVEQAEVLHRAAAKEWLPTLSTGYSFAGLAKPIQIKFDAPDVPELAVTGEEVKIPVTDRTSFLWNTNIRMPIYTSFALQHQGAIAKLGIDVAKMRLLEAKSDLIQQVSLGYFQVLKSRNYSEVTRQNLARYQNHEAITQKKHREGLLAKNSLLEIQAQRAAAHQDLIVAEKAAALAQAGLNASMGIDLDSKLLLKEAASVPEAGESLQECLELAGGRNPSLLAFAFLKKRAQKVVALERTNAQPKVSADFGYYRHGKTAAVKGDDHLSNDILAMMVKADWNLFDWFKTRDLVEARKLELKSVFDSERMTELRVRLDIRTAYLDREAARNKLAVARQGMEYAQENHRIAELRYKEQVAASTEVNDALVLLRQAQFNYYDALYEYYSASARLERAVGTNLKPTLSGGA